MSEKDNHYVRFVLDINHYEKATHARVAFASGSPSLFAILTNTIVSASTVVACAIWVVTFLAVDWSNDTQFDF
jgi:hypothetical protein